jgi:ribonuclease P protein component
MSPGRIAENSVNAVSGTPTGKFPKSAHLLKRADFQRVYKQGRRHFSGNMTVFYLRSSEPGAPDGCEAVQRGPETVAKATAGSSCVRVGFTVPRAIGKSVDRNRIRRRLREAVRHHLPELSGANGIDVVFNPKRTVLGAEFEALSKEVERAFEVIRKNTEKSVKPREAGR